MDLTIGMISPFFVRCGIAMYTEHLIRALTDLGCEVLGIRLPRFGAKTSELLQLVVDKVPVGKVDLIHVQYEGGLYQNLEGGFFGGLHRLGKPIVTTSHNVGNFRADAVIADASDRVIAHNEYCARHFQGDLGRVVVIPHGCSPASCPSAEEGKKALGIDPRAQIVGYQGFISEVKGLETLIEAMTKIRPPAALLIGGGWFTERETDYIARLKQRSLQVLPGRCQWLGYVPDEQLPTVYGAMSCLVYPSRWITESGALLMALSHGRAVIARKLPPTREKEKLGALITFKSVKDLRRKIKRLLKDEELRRSLEEGARKYAESVSWDRVAKLHLSLYEDVIEKRGKDQ